MTYFDDFKIDNMYEKDWYSMTILPWNSFDKGETIFVCFKYFCIAIQTEFTIYSCIYINLHFDCQTTKNWICDKKVNVCQCKNWRKGMMWWKRFTSIHISVEKYSNWIFFRKQRCCYSLSLFQLFSTFKLEYYLPYSKKWWRKTI